jgi:cytochrome c-type biogenesis protein CcmH/NrfG
MIVWLLVLLLALAAFLVVWRVARLERAPLQMLAAGLCLAIAGYAWQGRPTLPGEPSQGAVESEQTRIGGETFAVLRRPILGQFDNANSWLTMSEALLARGNSLDAVGLLENAVRRHPRDPDLWIGLGNALFLHANAQMTPAAEFAFLRAEELAPGNPAPLFFRGMALAQGGQFAEAEAAWRQTLAQLPPNISWRPLVEERLRLVMQLRAMAEQRAAGQTPAAQ